MTQSNDSLIRTFVEGADSGRCNRMAISRKDDWTFLWGFGHALYAARKDDGPLFVYDGWYGYSQTTSTHLNNLKGTAKAAYGEPRNAGRRIRVAADAEGGAEIVESPPSGQVLVIVDDASPGSSYGRLDVDGRPELVEFEGGHIDSPSGQAGR